MIALALFTFLAGAVAAQTLYKANWVEPVGNITINADLSITRPAGASTYNAGAVGDNILPALQNGFIQFTYVASTSNRFFMALNIFEEGVSYTNSQYAIQIDGAQASVFKYGTGAALTTTTAAAGDVFKIERLGTAVTFYKNTGVLLTLPSIEAQFNLRPEAILRSGTMPPVYCSFDRKVIAKPLIQLPTYTNNNGAVAITPEGGQAPFIYSWTPPEQQPTSSISSKPRGIYSVTITDAAGRQGTATYELGHEMAWTNLVNTRVNADNTLQAVSSGAFWDSGASSTNVLPANTNGWVEFIMPEISKTTYAIGLATIDRGTSYSTFQYGIYVHTLGWFKVFENNVDRGTLGSVVKGDRFRITRDGTNIIYSRNGVPFRTVTNVTSSPEFLVDVAIHTFTGPLPLVTASFASKLTLGATITPVNDNNTGGSVTVNVKGAKGTPTFAWTTGETGATLSNKGPGAYQVTVTDDIGQTATKTFYLGYAAQWTNRINLQVNANGTVTKTLSSSVWDAGALSANRLLAGANGDVSFSVGQVSSSDIFMVGLTSYNIDAAFNSMDYCFYFLNDGTVSLREKAVNPGISFVHQDDNIYRIERKDLSVRYYVNEQIIRTVTLADNNKELYADVSIKTASAPLVLTSFNYVPRTLYAVKNGNWTGLDLWSLSEGGAPSGLTPVYGDNVRIKGYAVAITSEVECKSIQITAPSTNTSLTVDGAAAVLTVKEHVKVKGENNREPVSAFLVKNLAKFRVQ
jgi:hypothetical protein